MSFEKNNIIELSEQDYDEIEKLFYKFLADNNIKNDIYMLYFEWYSIKNEHYQSYLFPIIYNYVKDRETKHKIKRITTHFFKKRFGRVMSDYKKIKEKEFDIKVEEIDDKILLPFEGSTIEVPNRVGHNYTPIKILPMEELKTKYSRHKRLKVFHNKGNKCVCCPRVGKYLIAAKDVSGAVHVDLYTEEFDLMTVDHIKPKSLGGSYNINNLDPMCKECNSEKGATYK